MDTVVYIHMYVPLNATLRQTHMRWGFYSQTLRAQSFMFMWTRNGHAVLYNPE